MLNNLLMIVNVVSAILLVIVVLLQRGDDGMGSALGGGGGASIMSADSAKNVLTRATAILGTIFLVSCLLLAYISVGGAKSTSVLEKTGAVQDAGTPPPAPVPLQGDIPSPEALLDGLKKE